MNIFSGKPTRLLTTLFSMLVSIAMLNACGGSGGGGSDTTAGIGGTGIAVGKVTGFGSIFVNDDRFVTDNSIFVVDGEVLNQSALAVGMVVGLEAETKNGEFTGDAIQVVYDDEIQGPIDSTVGITTSPDGTQKSFEVFGQTITIDDTSTRFVNISFTDFIGTIDDVVEISGFRISPTEVSATYAEKTGDLIFMTSEVELRGTIENYNPGLPEEFEIDGILIEVDRSDPDLELEVPNGILQDDLFVEVKGIIQDATTIRAKRIELEDENLGEEVDDVRLQGIISVFGDISNFEIDGQLIDASGAEIEPQGAGFGVGTEVEVEGDIVGSVLIADELEVEDAEPELRSFISSVDVNNNRFEVDFPFTTGLSTVVVVNVNAQTVFEDETGSVVTPPFSLDDLVGGVGRTGDYVRVEGQEVGGEILANVVKRVAPDDKRKLEGVVQAYTASTIIVPGSITVLGITYQLVDGITDYEPDPPDIEVNNFVEIEDEDDPMGNLADGVADEVEEE
ncbi:MAG: DUF5666 domain-containing protein [Gammaproteobacteria bacterium]|nr:DUF5666 domain-containing protein [Gammaproteobacteria bacterium]